MSKRIKAWEFTVEGQGAFPLDMLRYDSCYPTDSESVRNMDTGDDIEAKRKRRQVRLKSAITAPTSARWVSMGWNVLRVEEVR